MVVDNPESESVIVVSIVYLVIGCVTVLSVAAVYIGMLVPAAVIFCSVPFLKPS